MKPSSRDEQESNYPPPSHPVFQGIREPEEKTGMQRPALGSYRPGERRFGSQGRSASSRWDGPWSSYRNYREYEEENELESGRIVAQVIGAAILLLLVYAAFQSSAPLAQRAQQMVRTVMTSETDFSAVTNWISAKFKSANLAVPVLSQGGSAGVENLSFVTPLADFKVSGSYDPAKTPGLVLETTPGAEVKTAAKGQVETYDKNDQYGIYVIVDHGQAGKTLYGNLESVTVKPGDWLYTGQTIGTTVKKESSSLYFAYFVQNKPANPQDILTRARRR